MTVRSYSPDGRGCHPSSRRREGGSGLIFCGCEVITDAGDEPEYRMTLYGKWVLTRLGEPEE